MNPNKMAKEARESKPPVKWILIALLFLMGVVFSYIAYRNQKEVSEYKAALEIAEKSELILTLKARAEQDVLKALEYRRQAEALHRRVEELNNKLLLAEAALEESLKNVRDAKSWEELEDA